MKTEEIIKWLSKYNFRQLLLWIQTTSVHPNNQIYQTRFEYLLAHLLSIKPSDFLCQELQYKEFVEFITLFFAKTNSQFQMLEDFHAFSQLKLIPYFYNGEKYHFFYGCLERPREFIEKFDWMYIKADIDPHIQSELERSFLISLKFQTNLLEKIVADEESQIVKKNIYVPSIDYLNRIGPIFLTKAQEDFCINIGTISNKEIIVGKAAELLDKLYIIDDQSEVYFIIPQLHTEVLFKIGDSLLYSDNNRKSNLVLVAKALSSQFRELCEGFFSRFCVLNDLVDMNVKSLLKPGEIVVRIAENQLIIFHFLRVRSNSAFNMETAITVVKKQINDIISNELIGLKLPYDEEAHIVPSEVLDITGVILFEFTGINSPLFGVNDLDISFFNMLDIKRIFEYLDSGEEFIRYVRENRFIHKISQVVKVDALDEFAYYFSNGKKFFEGAQYPNLIWFSVHQWHDFYTDDLFHKYQDNIFEITEKLRPYYYDVVIKQGESIYEICNRKSINGGILLTLDSMLVLICYPIHMFEVSNEQAIKIGEKLLKPMISEYLIKLQHSIADLLQLHGCQIREFYKIQLCPVEEIGKKNRFIFLSDQVKELSDQKPFTITIRWNSKKQEKNVFFIYDTSRLHLVFSSIDNEAERLFVHELIKSFFQFYCSQYTNEIIDKISDNFIENNIPKAKRRYGMAVTSPRNPRLPEYINYIDYNNTDISIINRNVAAHLMSIGFKQGKYEGENAKKVNSEIYRYLQKLLEDEIMMFNSGLLLYAYSQIELIEGSWENKKSKYAIDLFTDTDFDVIEKYAEDNKKISQLSVAVKHIIATILKASANGNKAPTKLSWQNILAISIVLNETTILYELDEYDIIPYNITINDMFEINDEVGEFVFNSERYRYEQSRVNANSIKVNFYDSKDEFNVLEKNNVKHNDSIIPSGINTIFQGEYGFTFYEMINILATLGVMDLDRDINFPLNVLDTEKLLSELLDMYPEYSKESINEIIKFLSLSYSSYTQNEDLIVSRLMRKKERLNLCPIISLGEGKLLYGNQMCLLSSAFWFNSIIAGDYPYSINCPKEITNEMKKIHKMLDDELEYKIEKIAKEVVGDRKVVARLDKFTRISKQLPKYPDCGEIDLLVAIEDTKTILVADAKNINKRIRPYDIRLELRTFFEGDKSYLRKLEKKQEYVEENINLFVTYFGITDSSEWNTEKAFIVNHVYSSAFMKAERVEFILVDEFKDYLIKHLKSK